MRKKSPEKALELLQAEIVEIKHFLNEIAAHNSSADSCANCYDFSVIWLYHSFEIFALNVLVAQINRAPQPFYNRIGVNFGSNPTAAQCEYLLVGDRYFNFRGHSGFVDVIKLASGNNNSTLEQVARNPAHRRAFEVLVGLRDYAAHWSDESKDAALLAMRHWEPNRQRLGRAGKWLAVESGGRTRMERLLSSIDDLCTDMANAV